MQVSERPRFPAGPLSLIHFRGRVGRRGVRATDTKWVGFSPICGDWQSTPIDPKCIGMYAEFLPYVLAQPTSSEDSDWKPTSQRVRLSVGVRVQVATTKVRQRATTREWTDE